MERPDTFKKLSALNLNDVKEQKGEGRNALDYISWAWAWQRLHELYPTATSTIYKNAQGWNYHTDGRTCWVEVGVTVEGLELIEHLPVMDNRNHSIPANQVTSFDVNKALKRCLTKAIAAHGLGLYVYAGEDLPDAADNDLREETNKAIAQTVDADLLPGGARFLSAVEGHAQGKTTPRGTYRDMWAAKVNADATLLAAFDSAVENYRINNNI
jgi:hypothetical protein